MEYIYLKKMNVISLTHNGMMAYTSLKIELDTRARITKEQKEIIICTNEDFMVYNLFGNMDATRTFKSNLMIGLNELEDYGLIKIINRNNKNLVLDISGLFINEGDTYFRTSIEEIRSILNINLKDTFSLFHFAMSLISTIWNGSKGYGCNTIEELSSMSDITTRSVISYNKMLEDAKIIYIQRNPYSNRNEDGSIKAQANTYGRYENKQAVIEASEQYNQNTYDNTKRLASNEKQSIKASYNSFIKGTYKKSIKKLIEDVDRYNNDPYVIKYSNQIDTSVFDGIDAIDEPNEIELKEIDNNPIRINDAFDNKELNKIRKRDVPYNIAKNYGISDEELNRLNIINYDEDYEEIPF